MTPDERVRHADRRCCFACLDEFADLIELPGGEHMCDDQDACTKRQVRHPAAKARAIPAEAEQVTTP